MTARQKQMRAAGTRSRRPTMKRSPGVTKTPRRPHVSEVAGTFAGGAIGLNGLATAFLVPLPIDWVRWAAALPRDAAVRRYDRLVS